MAVVYRTLQRSLGRDVALKALHPRFSRDHNFIQRFAGESGALAALSHPNIVSIIDRGNDGDIYYFVMEFVDGQNLDQRILADTLTLTDWRAVIAACRDSLDYVHRRNIVHRDIKPSNILISADGQVKLADFGIAHLLSGNAPRDTSGTPMGTQHYMAPELTHDPANVDHRVDVYALGVTFYKMMTRRMPVGEFGAPSEVNKNLPISVDAVIFQALAPNCDDRYQNVKDFCDDLLRALKDQTMSIASAMNYRSTGASALYNAESFRTPLPGASSAENKKVRFDPPSERSIADRKSPTGPPVSRTPVPPGKSKEKTSTAGVAKFAASAPTAPAQPPAKPAEANRKLLMAIIFVGLLLVGSGIVAMIVLNTGSEPEVPEQLAPMSEARSPAQEREERERAAAKADRERTLGNTPPASSP